MSKNKRHWEYLKNKSKVNKDCLEYFKGFKTEIDWISIIKSIQEIKTLDENTLTENQSDYHNSILEAFKTLCSVRQKKNKMIHQKQSTPNLVKDSNNKYKTLRYPNYHIL